MKVWAKCNNTRLITENGHILTCDFCPCLTAWIVLGMVQRPLDTATGKPISCQNSSTRYMFAKIEHGHICLQWMPQKMLDIPLHQPGKDEVIYEWNGCEYTGHNCFNVKFYMLSPCFQSYAELTAYFDSMGGDSYFSALIAGKKLGWNVSAQICQSGFSLYTFYGQFDEETGFIYRYIFKAQGDNIAVSVPYPPGEQQDQILWNESFAIGDEELQEQMQAEQHNYNNWPTVTTIDNSDLCFTFSYTFSCGAWGYSDTSGYHLWNSCGLLYLSFSRPNGLNLDCKGVKFKMNNNIYQAYWDSEFKSKSDSPSVGFADFTYNYDVSGYGITNYAPPNCNGHAITLNFQLIDYIWE